MPNTLAHVGVQGLAGRATVKGTELPWVYLGCLIPDLPWILQRVVLYVVPGVDPYALQAYTIVQASLLGCLLVGAAAALWSANFWRTYSILGGNVLLHLVLDAMQTKWGSGAHFFAPVYWKATNWGLFWPESTATYMLTAVGLAYVVWHWPLGVRQKPELIWPGVPRLFGSALLLVGYFAAPFALLQGPIRADAHSIRTLRESDARVGHPVELDRVQYVEARKGPRLVHYRGSVLLRAENLDIEPPATVSVRGVIAGENKVRVTDHHVHAGSLRDYPSYLGLAFIAVVWMGALATAYKT